MPGCCWEYQTPEPTLNNAAEFVFYARSRPGLPAPDLMQVLEEAPFASDEVAHRYDVPQGVASAWTLAPGLAQPGSRGQIRLASALRVHGLDALRVADASVMPTIARGNKMAPPAIIAGRAARLICRAHGLAG